MWKTALILLGPFLNTLTQMKLNFQVHNTLNLHLQIHYIRQVCIIAHSVNSLSQKGEGRILHDWGDGKNCYKGG